MAGLKSSTRGLLLAVCLVLVAPASALADCGTDVINDYLKDGTINGTYSVPCYQQALGEIPTDADIYTDIRASITAAMTKAGGTVPDTTDSTTDTTAAVPGGSTDGGVVGQALNSIGPKNADEVPVPVIILGALAVVLILAGAGGLIAQRMSRKRKEAAGGDPPTGDTGTPETAG